MKDPHIKRFRRSALLFGVLVCYILAALIWWFISFEKQNQELANEKYNLLNLKANTLTTFQLAGEFEAIKNETDRNTTKYIAEGLTFIILILVGVGFIYRSLRKQLRAQLFEQHFMMAITHELKTPIAVARLNLETIKKYELDAAKRTKLIQNTLDETNRLNLLTNNILISSQLESENNFTNKEELDLAALTIDCVKEFSKRFPDRIIESKILEEAEFSGDPLLLQILINNLIENALKYSPKEKPVQIELVKQGQALSLTVSDFGVGIPAKEKKKIFNRFYRVGNEQTRTAKGTGLGLYLCQMIVKAHRGSIVVSDNTPNGSIFSVIFAP